MCGIVAFFSYKQLAPPVEVNTLTAIRSAMYPRGPDGKGLWISDDRCVGFGHRRLSIIDLTNAATQPMASADGRLIIVFNGEIYNYRNLRKHLESKGYSFYTHSDTEALLYLYADKGHDMMHDLRGMYAFAIWDKTNQGLFIARDPFGIKPLYYADDGNTLWVASQVKALLKSKHIDTRPEPAGHVGFFLWGHVPEPYTLYKGIRALPAGTSLWIDNTGHRHLQEFCNICDILANVKDASEHGKTKTDQEYLRNALMESVKYHLVADVPVGVFLSSGLDSATLTALASERQGDQLQTVSLGFTEYQKTSEDEIPLAEVVARRFGTEHATIWITKKDFKLELKSLLQAMDQPTVDGVNTYFVSRAAAQKGLKVALSGLGGDELFGGYESFHQIPRMVRILSPWTALPYLGRAFRLCSAPFLKRLTSPKYAALFEYGGNYGGAYLLRRGLYMPWELPEVLDQDLIREGWQALEPLVRLNETVLGLKTSRSKVSSLEMVWYMRNQLLRDADWAGMAHSLEIRLPFVDIELLRAIAPLLSQKNPPDKRDMALTPANSLPVEILTRRKTSFSVPVQEWLRDLRAHNGNDRGLRGWAKEIYKIFRQ